MDRSRLVSTPSRKPLAADDRPFDHTPLDTVDLPATPTRDRNISAIAWRQAPAALLSLGADLNVEPQATAFKRRIGPWLLWRAGPTRGPARYGAVHAEDLTVMHTFTLAPDGTSSGSGPSGTIHERFRAWKEDLLGR